MLLLQLQSVLVPEPHPSLAQLPLLQKLYVHRLLKSIVEVGVLSYSRPTSLLVLPQIVLQLLRGHQNQGITRLLKIILSKC